MTQTSNKGATESSRRVLIVGWDGADWSILHPLLEEGQLPNLARLIERGAHGTCLSTIPSHSWCAWPSFMTGMNPARHGVFDVLETRPGTTRRFPVNFGSIQAPTIFDDLDRAGKTPLVCNVPLTFPPPALRGRFVAGGVLPQSRTYTHPPALQEELDRHAPFPVNGMSWTTYRHRPDAFIDECISVTTRRQRTFEYLLDSTAWDLAVLVFVATDRIQHCLMEYLAPNHPKHELVRGSATRERARSLYRLLDTGLGRLLDRTTEDDLVVFMSDHGHQPCVRACTMDHVLEHLGFLRFARGSGLMNAVRWGVGRRVARRLYDTFRLHGRVALPASPLDWSRTVAYASVTSTGEGVSVNVRGREAEGIVDRSDHDRVRDQVAEALTGFRDPDTGLAPIAKVIRKEEVLEGPFLDVAPDLLLVPAPGYSLTHARAMVEEADWISGDHRAEGVLVAAGPEVVPGPLPHPARLIDLGPTALAALGVPSSVTRDGRTLKALVGAARNPSEAATGPVRPTPAGMRQNVGGLSSAEESEIEDHLRGLGYVE